MELKILCLKQELDSAKEKLGSALENVKDHQVAYEQVLAANASIKRLAASERNSSKKKTTGEKEENDEESRKEEEEEGKRGNNAREEMFRRERAKRQKLKTDHSKLRMYLKEKRKKLKELERKDRLIFKMTKDFSGKEKEFAAALDALRKSLDLEREKYSKVEKMNSILEAQLRNSGAS